MNKKSTLVLAALLAAFMLMSCSSHNPGKIDFFCDVELGTSSSELVSQLEQAGCEVFDHIEDGYVSVMEKSYGLNWMVDFYFAGDALDEINMGVICKDMRSKAEGNVSKIDQIIRKLGKQGKLTLLYGDADVVYESEDAWGLETRVHAYSTPDKLITVSRTLQNGQVSVLISDDYEPVAPSEIVSWDMGTIEKYEDVIGDISFSYEKIRFSDADYKFLEDEINDAVEMTVNRDKTFAADNLSDYSGLASEMFLNVASAEGYVSILNTYWWWVGAYPSYTFTGYALDVAGKKQVGLSDITGLSGKEIYDELLCQLDVMSSLYDVPVYEDDIPAGDEAFLKQLENQPFWFSEDGRLRLAFGKGAFFGKPEYEFYLNIK